MKLTRKRKKIALALAAGLGAAWFLTAGTGCDSITEEYNDAPVDHKYDHGADIYSMPDGFANFSEKCDVHGNLVITEKIDTGRAVAVVPNDPFCAKWDKDPVGQR